MRILILTVDRVEVGTPMPTRTIYVSSGDVPLYQRAQELAGGNLSAVIAAALHRYVDAEVAHHQGFEEIEVRIGHGRGRKVRFLGVLLGEWGRTADGGVEIYRVYRTRAGRFAAYRGRSPVGFWTSASSPDRSPTRGWRGYLGYLGLGDQTWNFVEGEAALDVADTLDELREGLPAEFSDLLVDADRGSCVEDLDI